MPQEFSTKYANLTDTELYILFNKLNESLMILEHSGEFDYILPDISWLEMSGDRNEVLTELDNRGLTHL